MNYKNKHYYHKLIRTTTQSLATAIFIVIHLYWQHLVLRLAYCTIAAQHNTLFTDYSHVLVELAAVAAVVQLAEYRTRKFVTKRLRVRLTPGPLQATLSKLLTYCVLRPTQPPTLSETGNE